jgi:hypothetical protein
MLKLFGGNKEQPPTVPLEEQPASQPSVQVPMPTNPAKQPRKNKGMFEFKYVLKHRCFKISKTHVIAREIVLEIAMRSQGDLVSVYSRNGDFSNQSVSKDLLEIVRKILIAVCELHIRFYWRLHC